MSELESRERARRRGRGREETSVMGGLENPDWRAVARFVLHVEYIQNSNADDLSVKLFREFKDLGRITSE